MGFSLNTQRSKPVGFAKPHLRRLNREDGFWMCFKSGDPNGYGEHPKAAYLDWRRRAEPPQTIRDLSSSF